MKLSYLTERYMSGGVEAKQAWMAGQALNEMIPLNQQLEQPELASELVDPYVGLVYGGFYGLKTGGVVGCLNINSIDGKAQASDSANAANVKNSLYLKVTWNGGTDTNAISTLNNANASELSMTKDEQARRLIYVDPCTRENGMANPLDADKYKQLRKFTNTLLLDTIIPSTIITRTIKDGGNNTITSGNDIVAGMKLTLLRLAEADGTLKYENILTEAQSGQVAFAVVDGRDIDYGKSGDKKFAIAGIRLIDPEVIS